MLTLLHFFIFEQEKGSPAPPGEKKEEESLPPIKEKWVPKNWSHFKKTEKEMRKMAPQLKSKMMAVST